MNRRCFFGKQASLFLLFVPIGLSSNAAGSELEESVALNRILDLQRQAITMAGDSNQDNILSWKIDWQADETLEKVLGAKVEAHSKWVPPLATVTKKSGYVSTTVEVRYPERVVLLLSEMNGQLDPLLEHALRAIVTSAKDEMRLPESMDGVIFTGFTIHVGPEFYLSGTFREVFKIQTRMLLLKSYPGDSKYPFVPTEVEAVLMFDAEHEGQNLKAGPTSMNLSAPEYDIWRRQPLWRLTMKPDY
jgi:hypothetical protein